ncbi:hypothetical protein LWI28_025444 [Acer negundo]|uniref:Uncharacterized protein n=1 Tax=Acer negundo TaxID=4023 RepID=A0AAD5NQS6_ACENE|nr:hypothetical protein LWI28_025444 [Acer negundo]KAK4845025.1 hypothetical protein QYF36_027411 [Acer negundo]
MYDQAHWKSRGTFFPQTFKSKLSEMGMLRLIPKMLALMAVQRQTAASRSRRPWMTLQHGVTGGEPMVTFSKEPSTSAHTPNLRASLGQEAEDGVGVGFGFGFGFGFGVGLGEGQDPQALTRVKKRMLTAKKRASDAELFEPISQILIAGS